MIVLTDWVQWPTNDNMLMALTAHAHMHAQLEWVLINKSGYRREKKNTENTTEL